MSTAHQADAPPQTFGSWLKQQRRRRDWTQDQLAAQCFCSISAIRKIESDDLAPSQSLTEQISTALHIPADLLPAFHDFARGRSLRFLEQHKLKSAAPSQAVNPAGAPPQPTAPGYYLPAPLTALIGRERELQTGCALLRRPNVRLVTLIGPPGAGKTRLSLALAEELKADFAHGACFVALAPISDPCLVLSAIAHPLQVREVAGVPLSHSLHEFLRNKRLLLVLDNFEQLMEAAPEIGALLAAAPGVKVLVSSREALKLYGEYEFPVPPLATPDINQLPAADLLEMYPAVELFVQRAQAVRPNFAIDAHNAASVAQICAWLDGLPLAIEMAAARIKWQTPATLLEQLRQQLLALTGGPRDLSPRQQTLRGAIDWSYNLLAAVERRLFVALAVINGGCTTAVAAALTGIDEDLCDSLLRGLVEKSLLQCGFDGAGDLRYMMLQMIREYAYARVVEQGLQESLQARHAAIYGRLVVECLPKLHTAEAEHALNRLEIEHNNLRSALGWHLQADVEGGLELAAGLAESLWVIRGYFDEGRSWLERLLAVSPNEQQALTAGEATSPRHARSWRAAAHMALGQGDLSAAAIFAEKSEALALASEEDSAVRAALRCRASIALHRSDYAQASSLYQQALALCQMERDQNEAAAILNGLGLIAKDQGDYERALTFHERSRALSASIGDSIGMARALTYASIAAYWQGNFARCIDFSQQCIVLQSGVGDVISVTYSREVQAIALVKLGRVSEGITMLEECAAAFQQMNDRSGVAMTLVDLGQAAYAQEQYAASLRYHRQALEISLDIGDRRRIAFCLEGVAQALTRQAGDVETLERAVCCFAAAEQLRQEIGAPLPQIERAVYDECRALANAALSPALYERAWNKGRGLKSEQLSVLVG